MKQPNITADKILVILAVLLPLILLFIACKDKSSPQKVQTGIDGTRSGSDNQKPDSTDAWNGLYGIRDGDSTYDHRSLMDSSGTSDKQVPGSSDSSLASPDATQALTGNWSYYYGATTRPDSGKENTKRRKQ